MLAGDRTSMEQLEIQPSGGKSLEIHIGEGGASLDKPSENVLCLCTAAVFVFEYLIPGHYAGDRTGMEQLEIQPRGAEALEIHIGEGGASLDIPSKFFVLVHQPCLYSSI